MMETINGCRVIASTPISSFRRIILALRDDPRGARTYITAAANYDAHEWDHGRYFTAAHEMEQPQILAEAFADYTARVNHARGV